jgi:putative transcriptional regulator
MIKFNIKNLLEDKEKSIYWLAENTDLTYTTLHRIANNKTEGIQFHTFEEIMLALDITDFNDIFKFVDDGRQ